MAARWWWWCGSPDGLAVCRALVQLDEADEAAEPSHGVLRDSAAVHKANEAKKRVSPASPASPVNPAKY
jgi:hypothetical protein